MMRGPLPAEVKIVEPEGALGRLAQKAFHQMTDQSGWIEDPAMAYLFFAAGFLGALQIVGIGGEQPPEVVAAVAEAIKIHRETARG